jgi:hypothetical protein
VVCQLDNLTRKNTEMQIIQSQPAFGHCRACAKRLLRREPMAALLPRSSQNGSQMRALTCQAERSRHLTSSYVYRNRARKGRFPVLPITVATPRTALLRMKSATALITFTTCCGLIFEASAAATPTIYAQEAAITASGDTVTATRIPIQTSSGNFLYYDVSTIYGITSAGALSVVSTTITPSASPLVSNFQTGTYVAPGTLNFTDRLTGPGVEAGGNTAWTFAANGGTNESCAYPYSATWYTGPIASNPIAARIQQAGITSSDYSYGFTGPVGGLCYTASYYFGFSGNVPALIGASQVGNSLTLVSFTDSAGKDHSLPVAQITFSFSTPK